MTQCSMKPCKMTACLIPMAAVFIFLNLYSMLVHGHLLMEEYTATASLWRTEEEMNALAPYWAAYYALFAMAATCLFKKMCKCKLSCNKGGCTPTRCPIKSGGTCFGLKLGIILGLGMASSYLYMPIPSSLAIKWFLTGLGEGLGIGIILGMTCPVGCGCASAGSCPTKDAA